ncbi:glycosyltransferase family 4 protein [Gordonia McavH-238-E]|uniref:glycosyltransferase family 4 protein n=1 Tax=Gordonia sp. McavH-238-E TaxID=2917736 RepID=UPI001EF58E1F|nr:glycosyltransferase family 4 protein [Gordonia sp. McavH-238-E]MCG7631548.1 glycosyltransferase family 4 protein [Gordonia sp. McavH-238-E]
MERSGRKPGLDALVVSLNFDPEPTGIAPYAAGLAKALRARGKKVGVLTTYPHYPQWKVYDGYTGLRTTESVEGVYVQRLRTYVPRVPSLARRLSMEALFALRVGLSSDVRQSTSIIVTSPSLLSAAVLVLQSRALRRSNVTVWLQDIYTLGVRETGHTRSARMQNAVKLLESWVVRHARRTVVIHDSFEDFVRDELDADMSRVEIIRNWTHIDSGIGGDIGEFRQKMGWAASEVIVLHAGNMGKKQALHNVIEAARVSASSDGPPLRFILMGDGAERRDLESLAVGIPNVSIIDPVSVDQFPLALASADMLLVNEGPDVRGMAVPSKLTSYFSSGRPVLAATHGATPTSKELQLSGAGIRVSPANPSALVEGARRLGEDADLRDELGRRGRRYFEDYLVEATAIDSFEGLIKADGPARVAEERS